MIDDERLAAYLSGDLDPAEQARVTAAIADDPDLRRRVDALRRLDEAIAALPDPEPSPGFARRLRSAVDDEFARDRAVVRLAGRRARGRSLRSGWLAPVAAALLAVAAVGVGLEVFGGGPNGAGDDSAATAELDRSPSSGVVGDQAPPADEAVPVVALGRALTTEDLAGLAAPPFPAPEADMQLEQGPATAPGQDGDGPESGGEAGDTRADDGGGEAAGGQATASAPGAPVVTDAARADVRRCLAEIGLRHGEPVRAVLAELATLEGEPVVVYRLAGPEEAPELLVVDQRTCAIRFGDPSSRADGNGS